MQKGAYYVYMLTNRWRNVLYIGVTENLHRRIEQHWADDRLTFTHRYNVHRLVYFERFPTAYQAISREKQLKALRREGKDQLIRAVNPQWRDLAMEVMSG